MVLVTVGHVFSSSPPMPLPESPWRWLQLLRIVTSPMHCLSLTARCILDKSLKSESCEKAIFFLKKHNSLESESNTGIMLIKKWFGDTMTLFSFFLPHLVFLHIIVQFKL